MKLFVMTAAAFALSTVVGAAHAASLQYSVTAVNVTGVSGTQSQATRANYDAAFGLGSAKTDTFTYTGALDFGTTDGTDATTIAGWLASGSGLFSGLDGIGGLQLSSPNINDGSATTTFFLFDADFGVANTEFTVRHDDGFAIFEDGLRLGGVLGPTTVQTNTVSGFNGGDFSLLYVATNGDPSILDVDVAPVPLPAPVAMLAAALAGLGLLRRRRLAA